MKAPTIMLLALCLAGCASHKEAAPPTLEEIAVASFRQVLDYPDSFELVSLVLADSVSCGRNLRLKQSLNEHDLEFDKKYLKSQYQKDVREKHILDSLETDFIERDIMDSTVAYTYKIIYRTKNLFGAKVLSDSYITLAPDGEVIAVYSDLNKMPLFPGEFPGYNEIQKIYLE